MKTSKIVVRCYARREGELWVAQCIDLCLATQDKDIDNAFKKLENQMKDYIEDCHSQGISGKAILRKAPLKYRLAYNVGLLGFIARKRITKIANALINSEGSDSHGKQKTVICFDKTVAA